MAYDFVRIGLAVFLFVVLLTVLILVTKKRGKSAVIAAFVAIIVYAVSLLYPFENLCYGFNSVEKIYAYRHHETLVTYAEGDKGVLTVAKKDESNYEYYTFTKSGEKYKLVQTDNVTYNSSTYGIFIMAHFDGETIIMTHTPGVTYNGEAFKNTGAGYTYISVAGNVDYSLLECKGEKISLV